MEASSELQPRQRGGGDTTRMQPSPRPFTLSTLSARAAACLALLALALGCQAATAAARSWAVLHLSSTLKLQWLGNVFAHLLRLPLRRLKNIVDRSRNATCGVPCLPDQQTLSCRLGLHLGQRAVF